MIAILSGLRRRMRPLSATLLLLLTGCSLLNSEPQLGHQTLIEEGEQAVIVCSQACADQGQCGSVSERNDAVVGSATRPIILANLQRTQEFIITSRRGVNQGENVSLFPHGTPIVVTRVREEEMFSVTENRPIGPFRFYRFDWPNAEGRGWVAGWCVARP